MNCLRRCFLLVGILFIFSMALNSTVYAQAKVNIQGGPLGALDILKVPPDGSQLIEDHSGAANWIRKWY